METRVITNNSAKSTVADSFRVCSTAFSKFRGLMFSGKNSLIFIFNKEKKISLHMLFVFFPIWAVYLNKEREVVYIKKLLPFISACYPKQKAMYVLELTQEPGLKIGDRLSW